MLIALLILILGAEVSSITFMVSSSTPICLEVEGGAWYHIEYIVSGANENLLNFTIYHKEQILLLVTEKA